MSEGLSLKQALERGIEAHLEGDLSEADRYYTAILKVQPGHPDANHNLGSIALGIGKPEESLKFFYKALESNPTVNQFWVSLIDTLLKLKKIEEAKAIFDQAKSKGIDPSAIKKFKPHFSHLKKTLNKKSRNNTDNSFNLVDKIGLNKTLLAAQNSSQNGQVKEAIQLYNDILSKFPQNKHAIEALRILSKEAPQKLLANLISLYSQGKYAEILNETISLLKSFPSSFSLYNIRGAAFAKLDQFDSAIASYKKALKIQPNQADAHNNLGCALKAQGKIDEAIRVLNKALELNPSYPDPYNNMGNVLKDKGRVNDAMEYYNKALSIKPNYAEAQLNLGSAFKEQGNLKKAMEACNKALSIQPHYAEAYVNMGAIFYEQGQIDKCISSYEKALKIKPDYPEAEHMLSALKGFNTDTAPRKYVENLFNYYANRFERSLVDKLEYKIPKLLKDKILNENNGKRLGSVLDLGCGTGLAGIELRKHSEYLEGIDLSHAMLKKAEEKNVYDRLIHQDIKEYLITADLDFDYFVSTDVFIYVGDLAEVFNLIKMRNKRNGKLAFTTEHNNKNTYKLEKSGRFSHSKKYIERLCKKYGYVLSYFCNANLRKENDEYLSGGIYILEF